MDVNKPDRPKNGNSMGKRKNPYKEPVIRRAEERKSSSKPDKPLPDASMHDPEEAIIDLYTDPYKKGEDEDKQEIVLNIDFTKPLELLGKIYQQLVKLARVAQSKIRDFDFRDINFGYIKENKLKSTFIATGAVVSVLLIASMFGVFKDSSQVAVGGDIQGVSEPSVITQDAPEFSLLFPEGKTLDDYDSLAVVSPPDTAKTYAYTDYIDNKVVQVSQQELPDRFKANQEQELKDLATAFNASNQIKGGGVSGYIGQYDLGGPQSVIAIKKDRLILIKSQTTIDSASWANYLQSLQ